MQIGGHSRFSYPLVSYIIGGWLIPLIIFVPPLGVANIYSRWLQVSTSSLEIITNLFNMLWHHSHNAQELKTPQQDNHRKSGSHQALFIMELLRVDSQMKVYLQERVFSYVKSFEFIFGLIWMLKILISEVVNDKIVRCESRV